MNPFNDKPIEGPEEDQFDFSPCAEAIAQSIFGNKKPEGTVIAIHGPWGSGKSSVMNLVRHYLEEEMKSAQSQEGFDDTSNSVNIPIQILDFKCWWFKGEEALMLEFFRQLYGALDKSGLSEAKAAISQLGSRILSGSAPLVGAAVNYVAPGGGAVASSGMNLLSNLIKQKKTVEELYSEISEELLNSEKRYLMIIDDIDRLSPDEALLIFRLVKSVGQLPKITYLLAYDREVAEKIVSEHYPSEGSHYLEKIVQAGFDIPDPLPLHLERYFRKFLEELWKESENLVYWKEYKDSKLSHFWNLFDNVVKPQIQSPRDVIRIMNTLRVTWLPVASEVDPADFLALETLRVKQPSLYATLKANKEILTGMDFSSEDKNSKISRYEDIFVHDLQDEKRAEMKEALRCLFPPLDAVWRNTKISSGDIDEWQRQKRACHDAHFDTYFRFSLSPGTSSRAEVEAVIKNSGNTDYVKNELERNENGTDASTLLDELRVHAQHIPIENAEAFLSGLFKVHDRIDVESDQSNVSPCTYNNKRRYDLLKNFLLVLDRTTLDERSEIISQVIKNTEDANLELIAILVRKEYDSYHPRQEPSSGSEADRLLTKSDMENLRQIFLGKVRAAAEDSSLLKNPNLLNILHSWKLLDDSEEHQGEEVKSWCTKKLDEDFAVEQFAKISYQHCLRCMIELILFDTDKLRQRVEEVRRASPQGSERYVTLQRFMDAFNER